MTSETIICRNCGNEFRERFCNKCGQKNLAGRFTVKEILQNFFHAFTHVDTGILFLAKELFFRPGIVAKEYIEGKRKKYFNPLQFLIITVAISTFLAINFNLFGPKADLSQIQNADPFARYMLQFNVFIYKYFNVISFLSVPITALYSRLIFANSGYNYAENLIFNTFIAGERNLFYIILTPVMYLFMKQWYIGVGLYYLAWSVYFGYSYVQFFGGRKFVTILKYICVLVLMYLTSQGLSMLIFTVFFYR